MQRDVADRPAAAPEPVGAAPGARAGGRRDGAGPPAGMAGPPCARGRGAGGLPGAAAAHGPVPAGVAPQPGDLLRRRAGGVLHAREARPGQAAARRVLAHLAGQPVRRRAAHRQPAARRAGPGQRAVLAAADLHRPGGGHRPAPGPRRDRHVGLLPPGAADRPLGGRPGRARVRLRRGHPAPHHPDEPAPGDRLDAAGVAVRPPGAGAGPAPLRRARRRHRRAAAAGRPSRGVAVHAARPGRLRAGLDAGRGPWCLAAAGRGGGAAAARGDRGRAAAGPAGGRVPPAGPQRGLRPARPGHGAARPRARPLRQHRLGPGRHHRAAPLGRDPRRLRPAHAPPVPGGLAASAGRPAGVGVRHQRRDGLRPRRRAAAAAHLPGVLRRRRHPKGA